MGAKRGWALSLFRESELTSRHLDLDLLTSRLCLVHLLLAVNHLDKDSLGWPSLRDCVALRCLSIPSSLEMWLPLDTLKIE